MSKYRNFSQQNCQIILLLLLILQILLYQREYAAEILFSIDRPVADAGGDKFAGKIMVDNLWQNHV